MKIQLITARMLSDRFGGTARFWERRRPAMVKAGLLGQKVRCGFYRHATPANSHHENVGARKLIAFYARPRRVIRQAELIKRLFLPMLLEATRLIQEKVVDGAATIDFAVREGLGLSGKRDGLLKWADQIGAARICRWLEPFACLGPRMTPTTVLTEMAHSSKTFYSPEGTVLTKPSRPVPSRH